DELESRWTDATTVRKTTVPGEPELHVFDSRETVVAAAPEAVFAVIERVGGRHGWFHANWLWQLRAAIDWLLGGVGMRRGRPISEQLLPGDPVDFWRVHQVEPNRRLTLLAEMKLPGIATLEFAVNPDGAGSRLRLTARFWPRGLPGRIYWYAVLPLHHYVFGGMLRAIARAAERKAD
ncbi:MAG: DUF2867 domain-containing protein, partial [Bdellovibrionales bacterium]|nr:DUF2867 domain-containing protein [Bdellovibrionales bacterium]